MDGKKKLRYDFEPRQLACVKNEHSHRVNLIAHISMYITFSLKQKSPIHGDYQVIS